MRPIPHIGAPYRHRNTMPLARREQPAIHPRCHVPGGSVRIRHNPGVFAGWLLRPNVLRRNQTSTFNQDRYAAALSGVAGSLMTLG